MKSRFASLLLNRANELPFVRGRRFVKDHGISLKLFCFSLFFFDQLRSETDDGARVQSTAQAGPHGSIVCAQASAYALDHQVSAMLFVFRVVLVGDLFDGFRMPEPARRQLLLADDDQVSRWDRMNVSKRRAV